jgi:hypothetical protein
MYAFVMTVLFCYSANAHAMPLVLRGLIRDVQATALTARTPVVIADLDETIIDSIPRKYFAFRRAVEDVCLLQPGDQCFDAAGVSLSQLYELQNRYDWAPLFSTVGIDTWVQTHDLKKKSEAIYLSGAMMQLDQALPGVVEFIRELKAAGADVFYVSSRYASTQLEGTLKSLRSLGLLVSGEEDRVVLRPQGMESVVFKQSAFEAIGVWASRTNAKVQLVLENEPENMNAMIRKFPGAHAIFVEGAFFKAEPLEGQCLRLRDFR